VPLLIIRIPKLVLHLPNVFVRMAGIPNLFGLKS